jgi:hypothetical protein
MQGVLVALLDAGAADVLRAAIGLLVHHREVVLGDAADVADHVRGRLAERVVPREAGLDVHATELVAVDLVARDLLHRQVRAQRHAAVPGGLAHALAKARDVRLGELHQRAEPLERRIQVLHVLGHDLEHEARRVLRQQRAAAVVDEPAHGRDHREPHAVLVGARAVVVVLQHLQLQQPAGEHRGQHAAHHEREHETGEECLALEAQVLERDPRGERHGARA